MSKQLAAAYARYSCDKQSPTSIADQFERCQEVAARHDLEIQPDLMFSDAAISGRAAKQDQRTGYQALLAAWEQGRFSVLIVDELSRLTRDSVEQALLARRLATSRVRLISADGLDTQDPHWRFMWGIKGIVGQEASEEMKHRVVRGMLGQLRRGYMIAQAPLGYRLDRVFDDTGRHIGTHWQIDPAGAAVVREVYQRRSGGQSYSKIAAWLNESNVPTSARGGHWRASRVLALLQNSIYKGEFTWNGSEFARAKAKREGRSIEVEVFARPALSLVSDELWAKCNQRTGGVSRTGYGGGKHSLAGVVTCGECGCVLSVSADPRCPSLHCASCAQSRCAGGPAGMRGYVALSGMRVLLGEIFGLLLSARVLDAVRERVRALLVDGEDSELDRLRNEHARLERAQVRLARRLAALDEDDEVLEREYDALRRNVKSHAARIAEAVNAVPKADSRAIARQLEALPDTLVAELLAPETPPEELRAVLVSLFPSWVMLGKEGRKARFCMTVAPGVLLALATSTDPLSDGLVTIDATLTSSTTRPTTWTVALDVRGAGSLAAAA